MSIRPVLFLSLLILTSCAYAVEEQIQDIYVETPGAQNAVCYLYIEKTKYKVSPPEKINVLKSRQDLVIDCLAPGNRRKKEIIEPAMSKYAYGDLLVPPALVWDYASAALYKYPDIITIDFTNTPVKPEAMPAQNRPDVKQPEEYPLEEKLPGQMRMNSDRYEPPTEFKRRETPGSSPDAAKATGPYMVETGGTSPDKGTLKAVNPAGPASEPAAKAPAEPAGPEYPGQ